MTVLSGCSKLTGITIPDSVVKIDEAAFASCIGLINLVIPDSVTEIGEGAFYGCRNIETATLPFNAFSSIPKESLKSLVITNGESIIDINAFFGCSALTSLTIPDSMTSINKYTFEYCTALESVTVPAIALSGIPKDNLKTVVITSGTNIPNEALRNGSNITSITIPDSVTSIGNYAFYNCRSLSSITFNGTKEQWEAIEKGYEWNDGTGEYTVHCTDGDITK